MLRLGGSNKQLAKGLLTADSDDEESVDSEDDKFSRLRKVGNASSGAIKRSDDFGNTIAPKSPMTPRAKLFKSINLKGRKQQDRRSESDPLSPTKSPLRTKSADGLPEMMSLASSPKATGKPARQIPQRSKTTGTMGMMFLSDMATASGYDQDMFKQFQGGAVVEIPAVKAKKNKDVLAAHNAKVAAKKAAKAALGAASGGDNKKTPKTPGNGKQKTKIRVKVPKGSDPFVVAAVANEIGAAVEHNKPLHCEEGRRRNLTPMRSKIRRSISGAASVGTSEYNEEGHHHAPHTPSRRRRTMNNASSSSSHEFGEDHHEKDEKESSHHQRRRHRAPLRSKSRSRRKNSQQNPYEHNPTTPRRTFSADDADLFNLDSDFTTNNNSVAPNPPQRNAPLRAPSMEDLGDQLTENENSHQQQTSAMTRTRSRRQVESCKSDSTASFLCENDTDKEQKTTKTFSAARRRSMKPEKQSSGAGEEEDATAKRTKQSSSSSSRQKSIKRLQPSDREGAMGAYSVQRFSGGCQPRLADHHHQPKLVEHKALGVATSASRTTSSSSTPATTTTTTTSTTTTNNNNNNIRVKSTFSNRIDTNAKAAIGGPGRAASTPTWTTSATGRQRSGTFVPGNSVQARVRQLNGSSSQ